MRKYLIIAAVVVLAGGGGAAYWFLSRTQGSGVTYRTEPVKRGELLATIGGSGTVQAEKIVDVGTQVAGKIVAFGDGTDGTPINYRSSVNEGTVLARIDDSLYSAKADQSRSQLKSASHKVVQAKAKVEESIASTARARADLKQAQARAYQSNRDFTRAKTLKAQGSISPSEYDASESAAEINNAAVVVAEAAVAQAVATEVDVRAAVGDAEAAVITAQAVYRQDEINLEYCTIKSPIAGTIIDCRVTMGQTVQSSFNTPSLFLIANDLKKLVIWASVNESDLGQINKGQKVTFSVETYPERTYKGVVKLIRLNATNTSNVVVYTVEVATDNPGELMPYMTANLKFEVDHRTDALLVPNAALRYRPAPALVIGGAAPRAKEGEKSNRGVVYVEENGKLRPIQVTTGLTDGTMTEILSGDLPVDTQVVVGEARTGSAPNTAENPFAPKMGGGKKQ